MSKAIDFLNSHKSETPSKFMEAALVRKANKTYLRWSREIALLLVKYMEENKLSRNDMANLLGVSPQYVSNLLSGKVNFSLRSLANLEEKLGVHLVNICSPNYANARTPQILSDIEINGKY